MARGSAPSPQLPDAARSSRRLLWVGAAIVLLLLLRVAFGDKPWDEKVQAWVSEGRAKGFLAAYGWWASLLNAAVVTALVATRRLWLGAPEPRAELARYAPPRGAGAGSPWLRWVLLAAVIAHLGVAAPRLSQSLWGDEEHTVRHAIVGSWYWADEVLRHDDKKWRDTFFYYTQGNNPVPMSALAKASWEAWKALGGDPWRCEPAVRAFPFVFGTLSVLMAGLFLRRIGLAAAGALAAWILVLHPWHLSYATQIRAYPLVLALVPATLYAAVEVLHRGTWRRWALTGVLQLLMLWVYPGALWYVVILNAALAAALFLHHRGSPAWREQAARLVVTGVASGVAWLQLMLPNLMQFTTHLRERASSPTPRGTVADVLSYLLSGMPWPDRSSAPFYPELADLAAAHPAAVSLFAGVCVALLALGAGRLARRGQGVALAAMLIPAPLTFLFAEARTLYLYPWYVIFVLPGAVMLVAVGLTTLFAWLREPRAFLAATAVAGVAFLLAFGWISSQPRALLRSHSFEPFRESVDAVRPSLDPYHPGNAAVLTAIVHGETRYYDPLAIKTETVAELARVMELARREEKPLFVISGRLDLVRARFQGVLERLQDEDTFELVAYFPAFLEKYDRYVYHYRGGPPGVVRERGALARPAETERMERRSSSSPGRARARAGR
jgi:hypothetical protein